MSSKLVRNLALSAVILGVFACGSQAQNRGRRGHAPAIGAYHLDMKTSTASNLVELTPDETQPLNEAVRFKDERIYNAPDARFAGKT